MCLSIPGRIEKIEGDIARVSIGGTQVEAGLHLIEDAQVGDFVLVHSGFALQKISEEEAKKTIELIKELEEYPDSPDLEE